MKIKMQMRVEIRDKNSKLVKVILKKTCKSWVVGFIAELKAGLSNVQDGAYDTGYTWRTSGFGFRVDAAAGIATYGIQLGTGTGAVNINDYRIYPVIAHGTGAGQLQYGATSVGLYVVVGSTASFIVARTFTNNSGASVSVTEVGLTTYATYYLLFERSLLSFSIANGQSATVTYTISVTV